MARLSRTFLLVAFVGLAAASCAGAPEANDAPDLPSKPSPTPEAPAVEALPVESSPEPEPEPELELAVERGPDLPSPPGLPTGAPARIAARHILIHYSGTMGADPSLRRSRAEAIARGRDLLQQLESGADFGALALKYSDGPSSGRRGSLGAFGRGTMQEDFEKAAFNLKVGELSDLVETSFGIHIIERQALEEVRLGHVLVQWAGTPRSSVERTKEEARVRAEEAHQRLLTGEPLAEVAAALSDGGSGPRGGEVGWFQKGHVQAAFEPVFQLERGGISDVVESVYGFHVLVRLE